MLFSRKRRGGGEFPPEESRTKKNEGITGWRSEVPKFGEKQFTLEAHDCEAVGVMLFYGGKRMAVRRGSSGGLERNSTTRAKGAALRSALLRRGRPD